MIAFSTSDIGLLAATGAFFAGMGAFLSGWAALKMARRRGKEEKRETT